MQLMTQTEVLAAVKTGELDDVLELLGKRVRDRVLDLKTAQMPRARVTGDVRPLYLRGATGRVGPWVSSSRRKFYPDPGTRAAKRGREWRVTARSLTLIEEA